MAYITHTQLHDRPGSRELAEVASDEQKPLVPYELMEASLLGADRSGWPEEDVANADEALGRIDDAVADADGLIDGYLRKRGYALPITPVPRIVTNWSRAIARYLLHKDNTQDDSTIVRDYKDALKMLQQVASGTLSLGGEDDVVQVGVGMPLINAGCRPIKNALKDY